MRPNHVLLNFLKLPLSVKLGIMILLEKCSFAKSKNVHVQYTWTLNVLLPPAFLKKPNFNFVVLPKHISQRENYFSCLFSGDTDLEYKNMHILIVLTLFIH